MKILFFLVALSTMLLVMPASAGSDVLSLKPDQLREIQLERISPWPDKVMLAGRNLCRLGRHKILATPFADYEKAIKEQLTAMLGRFGFDADRDIEAIAVNRWSHGYAYEYMDLHNPKWEEGQAPHELGRKPLGRISVANFGSEAYAYVQAAIDSAIRAVGEVTA
jgi:spermidine dehydrogenase